MQASDHPPTLGKHLRERGRSETGTGVSWGVVWIANIQDQEATSYFNKVSSINTAPGTVLGLCCCGSGEMVKVTQETTPSLTSAALWSVLTSLFSIWRWVTSILITQPTHPFQVLTSILATVSNIKVNATPSPGFGLVLPYHVIVESTFALHFTDVWAADVTREKLTTMRTAPYYPVPGNSGSLQCVW